jgi:hypothetical protein
MRDKNGYFTLNDRFHPAVSPLLYEERVYGSDPLAALDAIVAEFPQLQNLELGLVHRCAGKFFLRWDDGEEPHSVYISTYPEQWRSAVVRHVSPLDLPEGFAFG